MIYFGRSGSDELYNELSQLLTDISQFVEDCQKKKEEQTVKSISDKEKGKLIREKSLKRLRDSKLTCFSFQVAFLFSFHTVHLL